jgi:MFS family permease
MIRGFPSCSLLSHSCFISVTIISAARTIMSDVFTGSYPLLVTSAFAASYVMALSGSNMLGRLAFGGLSDRLGRQFTYALFGLSIPLTASIPTITSMIDPSSTLPLILFCGSTTIIVSLYGAVFAVLPAYVADTFGNKHMGTIFGRILTGLPVSDFLCCWLFLVNHSFSQGCCFDWSLLVGLLAIAIL